MKGKEISPEDFLTRAERIQSYDFLVSNEKEVIVLPNNEALGFRFNCYKTEYLEHRVDKATFDETVSKANKICENVWRKRKMEEEAEYSQYLKYILYVAILFSILSFMLLIALVYGDGADELLYASIVLIVLASFLTLVVVIKSVMSQPEFIDLEETVIFELTQFLDQENNKLYKQRKLQWELGEKFYFLKILILNE